MGAVLGLIAVSFAIWGIGDIFRGFGRGTVAKIGRTEISVEQFRQIYNDRLQQVSRQLRHPLSGEQARALGFDRQILGQLIAEAALDERARQLRLGFSDEEVAKRIMSDPTFRGASGQFDRLRFEQLIRQAGFSEQRFIVDQRRQTIRRQIGASISAGLPVPKASAEAFNRFENEQRNVDYLVLDSAQAGNIPKPTPEQLSKYFEERKVLFRAPEYRKLVMLTLTPADVAKSIEVSDADAKHAYEDQRDRYATAERRHVEQIVFPTMEEAKKAAERIAGGTSFAALAAERGLKESDFDLGTVSKREIFDRAVADAAFSLKEGAISDPVDGRFGRVLVRVTKIEPEQVRPFEQVAAEVKRNVALERGKNELLNIHDKVEDERAGGTPLADIAPKLNLTARTIAAVDRSGRDPEGTPITGLSEGVDVLDHAFASDVDAENESLQIPGGGYIWYDVVDVTPPRERPLDEVKERVEARWRDEEIAARLRTKAKEIADKLKGGATMAEVATENHLKVETAQGVKRRGGEALSPQLVEEVFRTAKDGVGSAEGKSATERVVFRVTDVNVPALESSAAEAKRIEDALRRGLEDDLIGQYIAQLEGELGVNINQSALNQALGGSSSADN
jgi:peptidyl-prolyl cis-trans isomerase D